MYELSVDNDKNAILKIGFEDIARLAYSIKISYLAYEGSTDAFVSWENLDSIKKHHFCELIIYILDTDGKCKPKEIHEHFRKHICRNSSKTHAVYEELPTNKIRLYYAYIELIKAILNIKRLQLRNKNKHRHPIPSPLQSGGVYKEKKDTPIKIPIYPKRDPFKMRVDFAKRYHNVKRREEDLTLSDSIDSEQIDLKAELGENLKDEFSEELKGAVLVDRECRQDRIIDEVEKEVDEVEKEVPVKEEPLSTIQNEKENGESK